MLFVNPDIDEAIFTVNRVVVFSTRPGRIKCEVVVTEEIRVEAVAAHH